MSTSLFVFCLCHLLGVYVEFCLCSVTFLRFGSLFFILFLVVFVIFQIFLFVKSVYIVALILFG